MLLLSGTELLMETPARLAYIKEKKREYRRRDRLRNPPNSNHYVLKSGRISDAEYAARLVEIPPDTRDLTGVLCGDPLPGRSALARRGTTEHTERS